MAQFGRSYPIRIIRSAVKKIVGTNWLGDVSIPGTGAITPAASINATAATTPVAGTGTITAAGVNNALGHLTTAVGTFTVSAAGTSNVPGVTTPTGTGTVAPTGVNNALGNVSLAGAAVITTWPGGTYPGSGTYPGYAGTGIACTALLAGVMNTSLTGTATFTANAILQGVMVVSPVAATGTIAPAGTKNAPGSAAVAGTGTVAPSGTSMVPGVTTPTGTGSVAPSGTSMVPGVTTPAITGTVATHGVSNVLGHLTPLTATGAVFTSGGLNEIGHSVLGATGTVYCYGTIDRPLPHPPGFPPPLASYPGATAIVADQAVTIHTAQGVHLYDFLPTTQFSLQWGRAQRQVSKCALVVPSPLDADTVPDIIPWLHWVSVWNDIGTSLLWTGPIQDWNANRVSMTVDAADIGAYMTRTRQPLTKDWDNTDPADIANEMWVAMIANNSLGVTPIVRDDPEGTPFDYQSIASQTTMDKQISDLVNLGLYWTVVAGVPILGPAPNTPWTTLADTDFLGGDGVTITRDGSSTFNDVLLYAADGTAQARVPMAGLNLQTVVQANTIFGVDNANKAVVQQARYSAQMRDTVSLGQGTTLNPDAPVTLEQLIPSSKIALEAYGLLTTMMIDTVSVSASQQNTSISLTLEQYTDPLTLPQLSRPATNNSNGLGAVSVGTAP